MKELIEQIERLKRQFEELKPLKMEDQQRLDKKFRLEWNYNSNHIEGNTLTYGETVLLLIHGDTKGNHDIREYDEMRGHDVALKLIEELAKDKERPLTESFIREINKIILKEPFYKEAITEDGQPTRKLITIGDYKSSPNSVRLQNGEIFRYAAPQETPALMNDLLHWYNEAVTDVSKHPVEVAAELHYRFVCIHPFDDGNGRISRLIMNYHLLKNDLPPVIIKSADKKSYLFALHEADTGNIESFYNYVAEQLIWSCDISIKAAKGESVDEPEDFIKEIEVYKKSLDKSKKATTIKSHDSVKEIWDNGIKKLFKDLSDALVNFDSLFLKKYVHSLSNDSQLLENMLGQKLYKELEVFERIIDDYKNRKAEPNSLGLHFEWRGFNNSENNNFFDTYVNIRIILDTFHYTIVSEPHLWPKAKFSYSQYLNTDDINEIIAAISRNVLEDIKQKTNASN